MDFSNIILTMIKCSEKTKIYRFSIPKVLSIGSPGIKTLEVNIGSVSEIGIRRHNSNAKCVCMIK